MPTSAIPPILDNPPDTPSLNDYDWNHRLIYIELIEAEEAGMDWRVAARQFLNVDIEADPFLARLIYERHLRRARLMHLIGYTYRKASEHRH